jgi:DNA polymerase
MVNSAPLTKLRSAARNCHNCPLWKDATQTVFGAGPADSRIMLVGEQPGDKEDLAGEPFVGPAGKLLDRALGDVGVDRDAIYVTNAVKHFKFEWRGKRRLHKTPAQREMEACRGWLVQEITTIKPQLIVALGATAARALLNRPFPILKNRGTIVEVDGGDMGLDVAVKQPARYRILITVHPSSLLRVPADQRESSYLAFVRDLKHVSDLS